MTGQDELTDSPTDWVADHIRSYVDSDGEQGHEWNGVQTLLLTTRGRRSGKLRRTALIYGRSGDSYVVVASKGGAPEHPNWYRNLVEDPTVQVQVGPDKLTARARTATADEKPALWRTMTSIWPDYDNYQTKTDREIPVVVLDPADH